MHSVFIVSQIFCSRLLFISWLQNHLLPCPFKYLTGIDCPGCGFQRAAVALIQGDFHESLILYPPAIPLIAFFAYGIAGRFLKLDNQQHLLKKSLFMIVGLLILLNYGFKILSIYAHYTASGAAVAI